MSNVSETNDNFPEFTPETSALIDARIMDQLINLQSLGSAYAAEPTHENFDALTMASNAHLRAVRLALEQMDDDGSSSPEMVDTFLGYIRGLDISRVASLNEIDGSEKPVFKVVGKDIYEELRVHLIDHDDDECPLENTVVDDVHEAYGDMLAHDLDRLAQISRLKHPEIEDDLYAAVTDDSDDEDGAKTIEAAEIEPDNRRQEILKKVGAHALDVAKVGLGVFVGVIAAKKSKLI